MSTKDPRKLFDEWNKFLESQFIREEQTKQTPEAHAAVEVSKPATMAAQEPAAVSTPAVSHSDPSPRLEPASTASAPPPATMEAVGPDTPIQEKPAQASIEAASEITPPDQQTSFVSIHVPSFVEYVPLLRQEHGLPDPVETGSQQDSRPSGEPVQSSPRFRHQRQQVDPEEIVPPDLEDIWTRLPKHLRYLAEWGDDGVAQRYYKSETKESRQELIARLTNPVLSLEDTARLLGVCPATVRRYTDRGWLHHFRTEGNQRRFRLSDIVLFLEEQATRPMRSKRYKEVDMEADQP
jgi:hypothetical protein